MNATAVMTESARTKSGDIYDLLLAESVPPTAIVSLRPVVNDDAQVFLIKMSVNRSIKS